MQLSRLTVQAVWRTAVPIFQIQNYSKIPNTSKLKSLKNSKVLNYPLLSTCHCLVQIFYEAQFTKEKVQKGSVLSSSHIVQNLLTEGNNEDRKLTEDYLLLLSAPSVD